MIRMQRIGRKNEAHFRIVLTDKQNAAKSGKFQEILGSYNPKSGEVTTNDLGPVNVTGIGRPDQGREPSELGSKSAVNHRHLERVATSSRLIRLVIHESGPSHGERSAA